MVSPKSNMFYSFASPMYLLKVTVLSRSHLAISWKRHTSCTHTGLSPATPAHLPPLFFSLTRIISRYVCLSYLCRISLLSNKRSQPPPPKKKEVNPICISFFGWSIHIMPPWCWDDPPTPLFPNLTPKCQKPLVIIQSWKWDSSALHIASYSIQHPQMTLGNLPMTSPAGIQPPPQPFHPPTHTVIPEHVRLVSYDLWPLCIFSPARKALIPSFQQATIFSMASKVLEWGTVYFYILLRV